MRSELENAVICGRADVILSDGETWDDIYGCRVVFYPVGCDGYGDARKGFHSVSLEDLVSCYLKGLSDGQDGSSGPQDGSTE